MALKALLTAAAIAAIIVGFALPASHRSEAATPKSQIAQIEIGR
jgi:hypothetical protein